MDPHGYFQLRIEAQAGEVACPRSWAGSVEAWALRLLASSGHCNPCRWSLQETQTHPYFSKPCNFRPGLMEKTLPSLLDLNSNICSKHLWVWGYSVASLPSNSPSTSPWTLTLLPLCVVMAGVSVGAGAPASSTEAQAAGSPSLCSSCNQGWAWNPDGATRCSLQDLAP